jgi:hypothetical protein
MDAFASLFQGIEANSASKVNAATLRNQASVARAQGYADEESQRRYARQFAGRQAAAIAQSGSGVGGSNAMLIEQDAITAELDALNIRYAAGQRGAALDAEAKAVRRAGKAALVKGVFRAGGSLMKGG